MNYSEESYIYILIFIFKHIYSSQVVFNVKNKTMATILSAAIPFQFSLQKFQYKVFDTSDVCFLNTPIF